MHRYGGLPAPLAAAAVFALSAALSLYLAAATAAYAHWRRGTAADAVLFAALWLLAELARAVIFTGFPWLAAGYSQIDSPLAAFLRGVARETTLVEAPNAAAANAAQNTQVAQMDQKAEQAKRECPMSKALASVPVITLQAVLTAA